MTWKTRLGTAIMLSLFFMLVYGSCNFFTTQRTDVGIIYFSWERHIPFVPWMTIPYLSIDLFFFGAPFLVASREELSRFSKRTVFVILIAALCYLFYPLTLAVERPRFGGWLGSIWDWFISADQPHNLMPSLHIALRTILAAVYAKHTKGVLRLLVHIWFSLIGFSTLLTYQHHVIDVFTGFFLGLLSLHLVRSEIMAWRPEKNTTVCALYGTGAVLSLILLIIGWPATILFLWLLVACSLQAASYAGFYRMAIEKNQGEITFASRLLFAPILFGQWLSWIYYRSRSSPWSEISRNVWLGRKPTVNEAEVLVREGIEAVLDLTSEFSAPRNFRSVEYFNLALRDLTAPSVQEIDQAVYFIARQAETSRVYLYCKAGFSRSVCVAAAYLLYAKIANSPEEAVAHIREVRPEIVVRAEIRVALSNYFKHLNAT
jgi:protein-tyrosine phosphatase/membrane-associated phospholipid phosphatase